MSILTRIQRKGPQARPLFGASTKSGTPVSFTVQVPTTLFILLIGMLKTRIQKRGILERNITQAKALMETFQKILLTIKGPRAFVKNLLHIFLSYRDS